MKYIETRTMDACTLRRLCIHQEWYTRGNNKDYSALFDKLYDTNGCPANLTTEKLAEIAQDILDHSDITEYTITSVMCALARECYTYFEINN